MGLGWIRLDDGSNMRGRRKCRYCGKPAVVWLGYANLGLCAEHYVSYYENKIRRMLEKHRIRGMLMVAVSGGKDSMALLGTIGRISESLDIDVFAFHINLGIGEYSEVSEETVKRFCKDVRVPLIIYDCRKDLGFSIPDIVKRVQRPACSVCGIVKRWVINKVAYENGFDFVATGHNIDDASTYILKALMTNDIYSLVRGQEEFSESKPELRLVGRIRPQFYLSERENMLYVQLTNIPIVEDQCPYSRRATIHKYKRAWDVLLKINPIAQINIVRVMKKIRSMMAFPEPKLVQCSVCGFPTESEGGVCTFCRLMEMMKNSHN